MNVLIIGSGGREHALGWKIKQSKHVNNIYFAPGNAGTEEIGENINIEADDILKLLKFAKKNKINLTVVGPEIPLALGIVDQFQKNGLQIFGPTKKASQLESSKAFASSFLEKYKIPHPVSLTFFQAKKALDFVKKSTWSSFVVKADGLAAGKGVIVCHSKKQAIKAIKEIMIKKEFGEAGKKIIIQEFLIGQELSVLAISDGKTIIPLLPAQDHKPVFDGDHGPNTGGMGAYSPVPLVKKKLMEKIIKTILQPTIIGMKKEGSSYGGVLYAGLMLTKNGPKVLEFNCRFGDPETQPILMLLQTDLVEIILNCLRGNLKKQKIRFNKDFCVCVVLTSRGYPGHYSKGEVISGLNLKNKGVQIFHAGTKKINNKIVTHGGRVLAVTALGKTIPIAIKKAYNLIGKEGVRFNKMHYRKDIGQKAIKYG